jgi:hypothetical protein
MNKNKLIILVLFLAVLSFFFYWFSIRPANIRKFCLEKSVSDSMRTASIVDVSDIDALEKKNYEDCLIENKL